MFDGKIFWGLDIGTDSVGWAVTNGEYKLIRYNKNLMLGVHLFDEAKQSAERRTFRTARRRLNRRQQRICLLQEFFAKSICEKDENFFRRLKESALLPEDSEHRTSSIFFDDPDYTDKDYFKNYPTIHHLICELMESKEPHDVRLVYLACAYLLAHRGHFLLPVSVDSIEKITEFKPLYDNFYTALEELCGNLPFDKSADETAKILKNKYVNVKKKELRTIFGVNSKKEDNELLSFALLADFLSGSSVKLSKLFQRDEYKELEKDSVCLKNADFDETLESLEGQVDETHYSVLLSVKALYDWSLMVDILDGKTYISEAKVKIFEEHKDDLRKLKNIFKSYLTNKEYKEMFKDIGDKPNYVRYVYHASSDKPRDKYDKKCYQEDFCKFVKKYLDKINVEDEDKPCLEELLDKCKRNVLCPKQVTSDNRVIPYQLYYTELKKILENASAYLSFLNERDEYGTTVDKILSIMKFRIPYYVGPLVSAEKNKNAWLERKAGMEGQITPWNFEKMVDEDKCESEFINRMTCKCTYAAGQDVLPKYSLLYCKFNVLNEINNIKVNGNDISVKAKQEIYSEKFLNSRSKVTKKAIKDFLISKGYAEKDDEITGVDDILKSSLKSQRDFRCLLENGIINEAEAEAIIERITVSNDKIRLKKWLKEQYPQLPDDDIRYILKLKYNDYGRLSRYFLEEILSVNTKTGEIENDKNIITILWETNDNLMQILSSKYHYAECLEQRNREFYDLPENHKTISERLKDMYIPTAVRRAVSRTLDIVKELRKIQGKDPDKIFIEMARGTDDTPKGKRTESRRDKILKYWNELSDKDIAELHVNMNGLREKLDSVDDGRLRSEKYFLYFMQLSKCMYTGKSIPFEEIESNSKWNIDHIWPQAKIKDDSLDNKVLVDTNENGKKGDSYPINQTIRREMAGFWLQLHKKGLISDKKYQRLMRNKKFTNEELSDFISRQLVETRQSTKAVAELLKEYFPNTDIVYVKANLASEFRQEMDMIKCREINDLHHAKDAYLNIVLGNVYDTRFTKNPLNFVQHNNEYSLKMYKKNLNGQESGLMTRVVERNGEVAWDPKTSFAIVRKMMSKNSIRYVRYAYKRKGGLFNQQPERKKDGLVPRKTGLDTAKYGGYNNTAASHFAVVKCKEKYIVIIPVEVMYCIRFSNDIEFSKEYAAKQLSEILSESIIKSEVEFPFGNRIIKINTLLEIDGFRCNIVQKSNKGRTLVLTSACSLILDKDMECYIKKITSYVNKKSADNKLVLNSYSGITRDKNIIAFDTLVRKMLSSPFDVFLRKLGTKIENKRDQFIELDTEKQVIALSNVLMIMKTGRSTGCNLDTIKESKQAGVITLNSNISKIKDKKSIRIIDQSPTGLIEHKSPNLLEL